MHGCVSLKGVAYFTPDSSSFVSSHFSKFSAPEVGRLVFCRCFSHFHFSLLVFSRWPPVVSSASLRFRSCWPPGASTTRRAAALSCPQTSGSPRLRRRRFGFLGGRGGQGEDRPGGGVGRQARPLFFFRFLSFLGEPKKMTTRTVVLVSDGVGFWSSCRPTPWVRLLLAKDALFGCCLRRHVLNLQGFRMVCRPTRC